MSDELITRSQANNLASSVRRVECEQAVKDAFATVRKAAGRGKYSCTVDSEYLATIRAELKPLGFSVDIKRWDDNIPYLEIRWD